jgi:hypothetical protein
MLTPELVVEALELSKGVTEPTWDGRLRPWIHERLVL